MSKSRTKELRLAFECRTGFTYEQRGIQVYKNKWRKFKKSMKNK